MAITLAGGGVNVEGEGGRRISPLLFEGFAFGY